MSTMAAVAAHALSGTRQSVYWSDNPDRPVSTPPLATNERADLVVVGGGFTGLWTALQALEDRPGSRVVVLEAHTVGFGASTRNGGFCDSSLTHGLHNGLAHWPDDMEILNRLGRENLDGIEESLNRYGIDCGFERTGEREVALLDWQVDDLRSGVDDYLNAGEDVTWFDAAQTREQIDSPTYLGSLVRRDGVAMVDPARLVWGLRRAVEEAGGLVFDQSPVVGIDGAPPNDGPGARDATGDRITVSTSRGSVVADRAVVATNAYANPVRSARRYVIPVYDHVLMTEPLTSAQLASIGWSGREGVSDAGNQFHYYRLSVDNRILWGGWDASYHWGSGVHPRHEVQPETHQLLAEHFFETFPQLVSEVSFTHKWAGPIGATSKFAPAWGTDLDGRVVWVGGFTGLGVGASRFGARVALDMVCGAETERTALEMVRKKPIPFPPEPLRWLGISITKRAMQRADQNADRPGWWLRTLDRLGVGFDS